MLKTDRGLLKFILLSFITCGIYSIVYLYGISNDINVIATKHDGKKTMNYLLVILLTAFTCGIIDIIWFHNVSDRIGRELNRRGINYAFGSGTYWGWCILGSLIGVGPLVYIHKLSNAMNLLAEDENRQPKY